MKLSPILIWLLLVIDSVAGATASTHSVSNPVERTRGRLRSVGASSTKPESRHDDPAEAISPNQLRLDQSTPPPQSQQPPVTNGRKDMPRDVFDRDPDESAIARHEDDPLGPGAGERQQDTAARHEDNPPARDVSGQFSFAPSTRLIGPPSAVPSTSAVPSDQPAPFMYPSDVPSLSYLPTMTPSSNRTREQPDMEPSMTPSVVSSSAPYFDCTSDDGGFFGDSGLNSITVTYRYEMEYMQTTDLDAGEVFKAVEKQASDAVLADLFPELCTVRTDIPTSSLSPSTTPSISILPTIKGDSTDEGGMANMRLLVEARRRLEAIGLSPQPADVFDMTATCVVPPSSVLSACNVAQGGMTVFLPLGIGEDDEIELVRAAVKASMNAGEFDAVHPAVRRISYVDETNTPQPTTPNPPDQESPKSGSSDGGIPIWAFVLIALGGLLFTGLGIFVWRRRRTQEIAKDTGTHEDDYAADMEEIDDNQSYEPPDGMSRLTTQQEEEFEDYEEEESKDSRR